MRKYPVALAALLLTAGAFFLPVQLSRWEDQLLMDQPHVAAEEEREGFAESFQLPVAEKLLLLSGGPLTGMDVGGTGVQGMYIPGESVTHIEHWSTWETLAADSNAAVLYSVEGADASVRLWSEDESAEIMEEANSKWDARLLDLWSEIQALQSLGGLPELWPSGSELYYTGSGETLYVDGASRMSFQVYRMVLSGDPYTLNMTVDSQSGRIISFTLRWGKETQLNWGHGGAGNFGPAWRDYWKLDSVSSAWNSDYTRELLECPPEALWRNGDYNSNGRVAFSYDAQVLSVDLVNWVSSVSGGSLIWGVFG